MNLLFKKKLIIISGPCVLEGEKEALYAANFLSKLFERYPQVQFIFKSSFDKANRTSLHSFRGLGLDTGIKIFEKIKKEFGLPILTDLHEPHQASPLSQVVDILQIPAFLCRQTDLLSACTKTHCWVNVKKGQFLAPWDMENVKNKLIALNKKEFFFTERGFCFGYNNLVTDFRAIKIMQDLEIPVIFDATHSVQIPGGGKGQESSSGERQFISPLSLAAIAAGADGIFAESHPHPEKALSDKGCQIPFSELEGLLIKWLRVYEASH